MEVRRCAEGGCCHTSREMLADSVRGAAVVAKDPNATVGEYLTAWLQTVAKARLRPATFNTYQSMVERFLIPDLGGRKLGELTVADVRAFLDFAAAPGASLHMFIRNDRVRERGHRRRVVRRLGKVVSSLNVFVSWRCARALAQRTGP
jgi:hypothetical protein